MKKNERGFKRRSLLMKKASAIFLSLSVLVTTITVPDFSAGYVMAEETEEIESVLLPSQYLTTEMIVCCSSTI